MTDKKSIGDVYAIRKFSKKKGGMCKLGEKIEGPDNYKDHLIKCGLVSTKKPESKK